MTRTDQAVASQTLTAQKRSTRIWRLVVWVGGAILGCLVIVLPVWSSNLEALGLTDLGPLLGIALVVASLFGDLPPWISWTQKLGAWLFPGIVLGLLALLIPLIIPSSQRETSLLAFSPAVWGAYVSIVLVGISFEFSDLPQRIYQFCQRLRAGPWLVVPACVIIAGLLGNILDGVSIMAISVIILLNLLPWAWALRASFALLFGGLISNLVTVAAEPTNIKFQDVLAPVLDRVTPSYWFTNWPISILGILAPALYLALVMRRDHAQWRSNEPNASAVFNVPVRAHRPIQVFLSLMAIVLLASGIVAHAVAENQSGRSQLESAPPLWLLLLPAGVAAIIHLGAIRDLGKAGTHIRHEWPTWGKLMVIFSLLWYVANASVAAANVFAAFFTWPEALRYGIMIVLSLASSITDNVALAAMQGALLLNHPLAIWQIRLIFILLTWAGGFTPFGCLQSLAVNSRLKLTTGAWFKETFSWAGLAILGGLVGLALIAVIYPTSS